MTDDSDPLKVMLWSAYVEGFKQSSEGWNGEYPWYNGEEKQQEIKEYLRDNPDGFEEWYSGIDVGLVPIAELEQLADSWEDHPGKGEGGVAENINWKRYQKQIECAYELRDLIAEHGGSDE